ncbi:MAG: Dna2/Cas4 domain-containing protein, partial [Muribaculaceae bacterium]|nr:Dna2/Cas4 domain-containing protein [Muribaculaceae bacterium]
MAYSDDDLLFLSGIQHFRFCRRQWALIHIDIQWDENRLTIEGNYLHRNADNPDHRIRSGETPALRAVSLVSYRLGITGISDVVELLPADDSDNSIAGDRFPGRWLPYPVEYKHGGPKSDSCDMLQVN